ncbi:sensor histidine kinase [Paenibacillus thermoaerophilus]|uniref:histidine kinase n=1 Tax=Paenibacillus thermoaerophilus TaxID=1215385 RepID=A0ABW2V0L1_9BACL|nr:sensor histidine kinase [Paenibacillus thermoaerophilus]TMV17784.1 sensor histidine kinase [Paenibacillus thermoaerophilus]
MTPLERLVRFFGNMRISRKLLISFLSMILLPGLTIAMIAYQKSSAMVERRVVESTRQSFEQANTFIAYKLNNVKDVSSILFLNGQLNEILRKRAPNYPLGEQIDDYQRMTEILRSVQSREVYSIRLYVANQGIYSRESISILDMREIENAEWYRQMMDNQQSIYCRPTYEYNYMDSRSVQSIISCVRPLAMDDYTGKPAGVLSIDILEKSISEIIERTNITRSGQVFLIDEDDRVISAMDKSLIGKPLEGYGDLRRIRGVMSGTYSAAVEGGESIFIYKSVEGTNWRLLAVIPETEVIGESRKLARDLMLVVGSVLVLSVLTAIGVSGGITRRIRQLIQHMGNIEAERWDTRLRIDSTDEIGLLQRHFNRMSENIRTLIQEKYKAEVAKKNAELQALQAQINPHFLYNTLELIHWMAMKHKAADISDVVGHLAKFFRLSLSRGRDVIPIRDEIEHVRTYLEIQNRRFSGKIRYEFDVDPAIEPRLTVKLILQPIVENAILHGILEKPDKQGTIVVTARPDGEDIVFTVTDDGVGMSPERLERLSADARSGEGGYGIRNVAEKLRLYYGDKYGLRYESEPGAFTRVTIRIRSADSLFSPP